MRTELLNFETGFFNNTFLEMTWRFSEEKWRYHVSTLDKRALIVVLARRQQEHKVTGNHNLGGGAEKNFGDDDPIKEAGKN